MRARCDCIDMAHLGLDRRMIPQGLVSQLAYCIWVGLLIEPGHPTDDCYCYSDTISLSPFSSSYHELFVLIHRSSSSHRSLVKHRSYRPLPTNSSLVSYSPVPYETDTVHPKMSPNPESATIPRLSGGELPRQTCSTTACGFMHLTEIYLSSLNS